MMAGAERLPLPYLIITNVFMVKKVNEVQHGDLKRNIIVLRSVFGKVGQKIYINPCRDSRGQLPECVRRVDSHGDMILSVEDRQNSSTIFIPEDAMFILEDGKTFDLDNLQQAAEWEAVKNCFLIAPNRYAKDDNGNYLIDGTTNKEKRAPRYGQAEFYVEMPGKAAEIKLTRRKLVLKAQNFIASDDRGYDGWLLIAKVLGRNMSEQPAADVEDYLFSVADKEPQKIIELYTGGDLQLRLLFITAKEKGVIRKQHGLYFYGENNDVTLGASDSAVIEWMKQPKNQKTLQLIRQDTHPEAYADE